METTVSLPPIDEDLSHVNDLFCMSSDETFEFICDEALEECMALPITNSDCFFGAGSGMGISLSDAGTSLSEMLQTESILKQGARMRTESSSSTSSVLTHLLQSDLITPPISAQSWNNNLIDALIKKELEGSGISSMDSECLKTSPTLTHILQSDQVTSSTEMAASAARKQDQIKSTHDHGSSTNNLTLAEILKKPSASPQKPVSVMNTTSSPVKVVASDTFTLHQALTSSSPLVLNKSPSSPVKTIAQTDIVKDSFMEVCIDENGNSPLPAVNLDCFPLFSLDEDTALFENGIAAADVTSLLSQFEEAAVNFSEEPVVSPASAASVSPVATEAPVVMATPKPVMRTSSHNVFPTSSAGPVVSTTVLRHSNSAPVMADPESEVVKLLKAKSPLLPKPTPTVSRAPQPIPPPEMIEKIKAASKRKTAIMLNTPPVSKTNGVKRTSVPTPAIQPHKSSGILTADKARTGEPKKKSQLPSNYIPPPMPLALLQASSRSSSPVRMSLPEIDLENFTPAPSPASSSCDISQPPTPNNKPVKRISISQYKHRIRSCQSSGASSPVPSSPASSVSTDNTVTQAAALLGLQVDEDEESKSGCTSPDTVNTSYFDLIADHDYCQNVPQKAVSDEVEAHGVGITGLGEEFHMWQGEMDVVASEVVVDEVVVDEVAVKQEVESASAVDTQVVQVVTEPTPPGVVAMQVSPSEDAESGHTVLKSLLLNSNLEEECKVQAVKDRVLSQQNMSMPQQLCIESKRVDQDRIPDTSGSQGQLVPTDVKEEQCLSDNVNEDKKASWTGNSRGRLRGNNRHKRQYRKNSSPEGAMFDKLPTYYTALATPAPPGMPRNDSTTNLLQRHRNDQRMPDRDRDPSPDRSDPMFNKMPAYLSCFTNSTKYDQSHDSIDIDNSHTDADWDCIPGSQPMSSRNASPTNSISQSERREWSSRQRSPSPGRSRLKKQYSSRSRQPQRSRQSRQRSYSSSSSCSTCSSRSSSESPERYSSRHRNRSQYRSRSPVRSRSGSGRFARSGSRESCFRKSRTSARSSNSRSGSCQRSDRQKQIQIEERRIVYVGRIPGDFTRRNLREKFECFGEITDVSVHFREHGDNYGFVTYRRTKDAYNCVEKGTLVAGCEAFDMCFGGRREFCKTEYADLDGNMEIEEEMSPVMGRRGGGGGRSGGRGGRSSSSAALDFDSLLKSTMQTMKRKH